METTRELKFGRVAHQVQVYSTIISTVLDFGYLVSFLRFYFLNGYLSPKTVIFDWSGAKLTFQKLRFDQV